MDTFYHCVDIPLMVFLAMSNEAIRVLSGKRKLPLGIMLLALALTVFIHADLRHHCLALVPRTALLSYGERFNGWWKKLTGKIRSAALSVVNAASFERQLKESF